MCPMDSRPMMADPGSSGASTHVYHGIIRQFDDGLWGVLFFEIGVMAMARSRREAVRQAIELLEFERARTGPDEVPVGAITLEALGEFMSSDAPAESTAEDLDAISLASEFKVSPFEYAVA